MEGQGGTTVKTLAGCLLLYGEKKGGKKPVLPGKLHSSRKYLLP